MGSAGPVPPSSSSTSQQQLHGSHILINQDSTGTELPAGLAENLNSSRSPWLKGTLEGPVLLLGTQHPLFPTQAPRAPSGIPGLE